MKLESGRQRNHYELDLALFPRFRRVVLVGQLKVLRKTEQEALLQEGLVEYLVPSNTLSCFRARTVSERFQKLVVVFSIVEERVAHRWHFNQHLIMRNQTSLEFILKDVAHITLNSDEETIVQAAIMNYVTERKDVDFTVAFGIADIDDDYRDRRIIMIWRRRNAEVSKQEVNDTSKTSLQEQHTMMKIV